MCTCESTLVVHYLCALLLFITSVYFGCLLPVCTLVIITCVYFVCLLPYYLCVLWLFITCVHFGCLLPVCTLVVITCVNFVYTCVYFGCLIPVCTLVVITCVYFGCLLPMCTLVVYYPYVHVCNLFGYRSKGLKGIDTLSMAATLPVVFISFLKGIFDKRKEFAPCLRFAQYCLCIDPDQTVHAFCGI